MKPQERVLTALRHGQPDRVPCFYRDVPETRTRLLHDLGCADDEELFHQLGIDFRWVQPDYVGPDLEDPVTGNRQDIWGVKYRYVAFSGSDGYWEPVANPMREWTDPARLDGWAWPSLDWFDFSSLPGQIERHADYAIMTAPNYSSPGLFQCPVQALVGEEQSFLLPLTDPEFFRALVDRALAFNVAFVDRMCAAARLPGGRGIDFFRIGDDFGTQQSLVMSPAMWREFIAPGLKAMADAAKRHGAHYYQHSCGAVRELIPDFIDIGVDVLDPVQVTAAGMVPSELKNEFGDRLCFSGGVDEMHLLREGSPGDVRRAVRELLDTMAPGGGFFLGPTHNFQVDIPTENIAAMYEEGRQQ
jgi:uroporphyrinogen decarboxylase